MNRKIKISPELRNEAKNFQEERNKQKEILTNNDRGYDKFTCTNRDAFDGYIAEQCVKQILAEENIPYSSWRDEHYISNELKDKINNGEKNLTEQELDELESVFYDDYDIQINGLGNVDVKTAATDKEPNPNWVFGIPEIQIERPGKDATILGYLLYDDNPKTNPEAIPVEFQLIGFKKNGEIKKGNAPVIHNSYAGFPYQIPNYEVKVEDFNELSIEEIKKISSNKK